MLPYLVYKGFLLGCAKNLPVFDFLVDRKCRGKVKQGRFPNGRTHKISEGRKESEGNVPTGNPGKPEESHSRKGK